MGGFSYPAPIDFSEEKVDHEQQRNTSRTRSERAPPSRSRSADALSRPARHLPKTKSGRHLPKPGGPTSSKHRKAPGKSRSGGDLEELSRAALNYSSDSGTRNNSSAVDDINHGARHSASSSSGLVTPTKNKTKKKKSSSLRSRLTPSPSGKPRSLKGLLPSPKSKDSLPSKKPQKPKSLASLRGKPSSPTPGTPPQRKPRSLKTFFPSPLRTATRAKSPVGTATRAKSPLRTATRAKSGSELDNMRQSLVDLQPFPDEGTRQVEGGRTARTARTSRTKKNSKSEHGSDRPRSFKELLSESNHSQTSKLAEMRQKKRNKAERELSLTPEEVHKPLSSGLITGILDSVGHLFENFLDDEDTDDEDERVSRFDDGVGRIAGWAG